MLVLVIGMVLFLGIHSVSIVAPQWRSSMKTRLGDNGWKGLYSLVALVGLVLIIIGYDMARQDPILLYNPPVFMRHIAALLMLPVFPLLLATYLPGKIKTKMKHPMLTAVKFWALAHLLANGTLADVVLFGGFLAWAVADRISLKRRPAQEVPTLPGFGPNDAIAVIVGLGIYLLFVMWAHLLLIGVRPF